MAVYQGVRLRTSALPPATPLPRTRAARATTATSTTTPRLRPVGLLMAGILASTMLGLVYLTQTLGANATSEVIGGLRTSRRRSGPTWRSNPSRRSRRSTRRTSSPSLESRAVSAL